VLVGEPAHERRDDASLGGVGLGPGTVHGLVRRGLSARGGVVPAPGVLLWFVALGLRRGSLLFVPALALLVLAIPLFGLASGFVWLALVLVGVRVVALVALGRGRLVGSALSLLVVRAGGLAVLAHHGYRGPHTDRLALLDQDLLDRARRRGWDLRVDLVGRDLHQQLILGDRVTLLLEPLGDRALDDRLAQLGHLYLCRHATDPFDQMNARAVTSEA
jgi:hypothetical protein